MMDADNTLPVIGKLTSIYASSLLIALLTAIVSIAGLLSPHLFYPTEELVQTFVPNDVVDLFIGVPILLGSIWAARRGKLLGLLFWLGALFFGFYNSIAYAFTLPFNWGFLLHLLLVVIDVYTLIALAVSVDGKAIQHQLRDAVYEKINGGVLAGFGFFFFLRVIAISVNALIVGSALTETELAPNISDIFVAPAFIIIGIALWKRKTIGYVAGLALLFQVSMLFIGLIILLLLQPILTSAPFAVTDFIVILLMGFICYVPCILFMRGVMARSR